ncbi:hypothetical protein [Pelagicoccus sp. SDUM812005]|uniref:hypothetical protein n=1 Tax=Pelagicoccus sp. SDUM812005 TaxID=3041257 RepID=UPI0028104332|nr:hypothetical protein [Pelagicoccus sp. SDUM812005]MDQ8182991.1 hypothetical protein [Pelagicoccus sp. SDUM812005]
MKKSKVLVSLLSFTAIVFGLTLSGCGQKTEEEKAADSLSSQADSAAKAAEKEAGALKQAAEKEAAKH